MGARPHIEMRPWHPEEDQILLSAINEHGSKWRSIATRLPGRSQAMCRNRYQRITAPSKPGVKSRNRCTTCGEFKRGHTCLAKLQEKRAFLSLDDDLAGAGPDSPSLATGKHHGSPQVTPVAGPMLPPALSMTRPTQEAGEVLLKPLPVKAMSPTSITEILTSCNGLPSYEDQISMQMLPPGLAPSKSFDMGKLFLPSALEMAESLDDPTDMNVIETPSSPTPPFMSTSTSFNGQSFLTSQSFFAELMCL